MKYGKHLLVGNVLSITIVLVEVASVFLNFSGAASYNFFVDEFYLLLAFLLFTSMFASKLIVILNTVLTIATAILAFTLKKNSFPEEIIGEFKMGLNVYILVVVVIFSFSFLYNRLILKAVREISDSITETEEKNTELAENAELMKIQRTELIIAKEKAEESDRLKSSFLANMSHEIRTPMNAILGFTNILKDTKLNDKQNDYLKIIESSGNHLLDLINDIIDISELESNQVIIKETEINLNSFLDEIKMFFEATLINDKKDIKLILKPTFANGKDQILIDAKRLRQILINLIGNSMKFTHKGSINIGYHLVNNSELLFKIEDTGIGISQKELPIIFDRFRQADETSTKQYGGTGLGLAISKACVNILGGKIYVESKKGVGSSFYFTVPYKI